MLDNIVIRGIAFNWPADRVYITTHTEGHIINHSQPLILVIRVRICLILLHHRNMSYSFKIEFLFVSFHQFHYVICYSHISMLVKVWG